MPLIFGSSVPGNHKLVTDLLWDLNSRPRADSQGLLTRDFTLEVSRKVLKAGHLECCVHVHWCVSVLMGSEDVVVCAVVCLKDTICVSLRSARSPRPHHLSPLHEVL
jgi:hypothetical protein